MTETHHGVEVGAERITHDGRYRPIVDGDFYGTRIYVGSRDALAAARRGVERRLGITRLASAASDADPEAAWAEALREAIR